MQDFRGKRVVRCKGIWTVLLVVVVGIGDMRAETNAMTTNGLAAGNSNQEETPQTQKSPTRRGWIEGIGSWIEENDRKRAEEIRAERAKIPESQRLPGDDTSGLMRFGLTVNNANFLSSIRDNRTGNTWSVNFSSFYIYSIDWTTFLTRMDGWVYNYVWSIPWLSTRAEVMAKSGNPLFASPVGGLEFSFGRSFALSEESWLLVMGGVSVQRYGFFEKASTNRIFRTGGEGIVLTVRYKRPPVEATLSTSVLFGELFAIDAPHRYLTPVYPMFVIRLSLGMPLVDLRLR